MKLITLILTFSLIFLFTSENEIECMDGGERDRFMIKIILNPNNENIEALLNYIHNSGLSETQINDAMTYINRELGVITNNNYAIHNGELHNAGNPPISNISWGWRDFATAAILSVAFAGIIYLTFNYWEDIRNTLFGSTPEVVATVVDPRRQDIVRGVMHLVRIQRWTPAMNEQLFHILRRGPFED